MRWGTSSVQEEVKRLREAPTLLGNSGVPDRQPDGGSRRGQFNSWGGGQVRVFGHGPKTSLGIKLGGGLIILFFGWLNTPQASALKMGSLSRGEQGMKG